MLARQSRAIKFLLRLKIHRFGADDYRNAAHLELVPYKRRKGGIKFIARVLHEPVVALDKRSEFYSAANKILPKDLAQSSAS